MQPNPFDALLPKSTPEPEQQQQEPPDGLGTRLAKALASLGGKGTAGPRAPRGPGNPAPVRTTPRQCGGCDGKR